VWGPVRLTTTVGVVDARVKAVSDGRQAAARS